MVLTLYPAFFKKFMQFTQTVIGLLAEKIFNHISAYWPTACKFVHDTVEYYLNFAKRSKLRSYNLRAAGTLKNVVVYVGYTRPVGATSFAAPSHTALRYARWLSLVKCGVKP